MAVTEGDLLLGEPPSLTSGAANREVHVPVNLDIHLIHGWAFILMADMQYCIFRTARDTNVDAGSPDNH